MIYQGLLTRASSPHQGGTGEHCVIIPHIPVDARQHHGVARPHVERGEGSGAVSQGRVNLEVRHNLVFEILHSHRGDVPELLENFKSSRGILIFGDCPQHRENLVKDLAGDKTAHVDVDVLQEGHAEQGDPRLYCCQDVTVTRELMVPPLGFPPGQF